MKKQHDYSILPVSGVVVKKSPVHGFGVFATKCFQEDSIIEIAPFIKVTTNYEVLQYTILSRYVFGREDRGFSLIGLGFSSIYNHKDKPNAQFDVADNLIIISALERIKKGSEIFVSYGDNYDFGVFE